AAGRDLARGPAPAVRLSPAARRAGQGAGCRPALAACPSAAWAGRPEAAAGRPSKRQQARRRQRGPTAREKAAFVWKHRFLIVKRTAKLTPSERDDLKQLFAYLPELRTLGSFSQNLYRLLDDSATLWVARWRWTWLRYDPEYQEVRE